MHSVGRPACARVRQVRGSRAHCELFQPRRLLAREEPARAHPGALRHDPVDARRPVSVACSRCGRAVPARPHADRGADGRLGDLGRPADPAGASLALPGAGPSSGQVPHGAGTHQPGDEPPGAEAGRPGAARCEPDSQPVGQAHRRDDHDEPAGCRRRRRWALRKPQRGSSRRHGRADPGAHGPRARRGAALQGQAQRRGPRAAPGAVAGGLRAPGPEEGARGLRPGLRRGEPGGRDG
mmetsp:Transcript_25446/g.78318  ORF Transcript_25446/g.78318 Transcript_25446/m.78318 type:complete len:238 (+) Transcript_25446:901-1614(+)